MNYSRVPLISQRLVWRVSSRQGRFDVCACMCGACARACAGQGFISIFRSWPNNGTPELCQDFIESSKDFIELARISLNYARISLNYERTLA